jgi:hypothetical protein
MYHRSEAIVVEALNSEADPTRLTVGPAESTGGLPVEAGGVQTRRLDDGDDEILDAPRPTPMAERLEEGSRVGRFVVLERVGAGGRGWCSAHTTLGSAARSRSSA